MEDAIATGWLLAGASLIAATWVGVDGAGAADAVSYRGPQNNGIYEETGLVKAWPADGPRFLWKRMLGQAYGGASVSDGIVWIASDARGCLYGFTLDGELRYKHPFGSTTWKRFTGPRCTPLIRDGIGVVARPNADIYAMDLTTAEKRWSVNAWKGFGSGKGDMGWGYPSSSVAFEDTVILNTVSRDDETPPIVAVDFATGRTVWEADAGKGKKYSCGDHAASVFRHSGRWLNVNPTWRYILCLDPRTGETLWEIPDPDTTQGSEKTLTPVYGDGYLLFDRAGIVTCVKLDDDGRGFAPLWAQPFVGGFSHAVILNRRAYFESDATQPFWRGDRALLDASARAQGLLRVERPRGAPPLPPFPRGLACFDVETGELLDVLRMAEGLGHVVAADGMVYAVDYDRGPKYEEGVSGLGLNVFLIRPTPTGMAVAGQFRLPMTPDDAKVRDLEWQANVPPVVAAGRLFVRYGPLWAYDLRPASNGSREPSVPAPPGTAYWDLNFRGFCPGNRDLFVTLDVKEGAFVSGAAAAPSWNRATHWIERAEVKTVEDGLSGTLRVRLNSDGVVPPDRRPVLAQVWIDVKCVQGGLVGSYAGGLADGTLIDGHVTGR